MKFGNIIFARVAYPIWPKQPKYIFTLMEWKVHIGKFGKHCIV